MFENTNNYIKSFWNKLLSLYCSMKSQLIININSRRNIPHDQELCHLNSVNESTLLINNCNIDYKL